MISPDKDPIPTVRQHETIVGVSCILPQIGIVLNVSYFFSASIPFQDTPKGEARDDNDDDDDDDESEGSSLNSEELDHVWEKVSWPSPNNKYF